MSGSVNAAIVREKICEIGRRLYDRQLIVAADGNISARLSDSEILCTATSISKGHMTVDDICTLDLSGHQTAGSRKATSESRLHLEVYRRRQEVTSVIHAHPPHATAFAMTREVIPAGILPEVELFLGEVPIAAYATPGTEALAESIRPFLDRARILLLANHGTLSFDDSDDCSQSLERSLWWTETLENYCRVLILSRSLGKPAYLTQQEMQDVIASKEKWGLDDPRFGEEFANCDWRMNPVFRDSWQKSNISRDIFPPPDDDGRQQ